MPKQIDKSEPQHENEASTARDREMGRDGQPLGDLGKDHETWKPPAGEQGISNRPDDEGTMTDKNPSPLDAEEQEEDLELDEDDEFEDDEETDDTGDEDDEAGGDDEADEGPA